MKKSEQNRLKFGEQFIIKAKIIHQEKYDYSLVKYKNNNSNIEIVCKNHGIFNQTPSNHLAGNNCPKCVLDAAANRYKKDLQVFIKEALIIHNNFYSYEKTVYTNNRSPILIKCPIHGYFKQSPISHLHGHGCKICGTNRTAKLRSKDFIEFKNQFNKKYNYKYNYSKSNYTNSNTKICIICPIHGEFWQAPNIQFKS